jgi:hypothetical protein
MYSVVESPPPPPPPAVVVLVTVELGVGVVGKTLVETGLPTHTPRDQPLPLFPFTMSVLLQKRHWEDLECHAKLFRDDLLERAILNFAAQASYDFI